MKIQLPSILAGSGGRDQAIARYRLLAIEQAARIMRGSSALAPAADERMVRDLYSLSESAAIDASIARASPGVAAWLKAERAQALVERGPRM
jgi:nitric oxide reductase NorD protein